MSGSRKRSRKSKIEVREDDCEFEVVCDDTNNDVHLQLPEPPSPETDKSKIDEIYPEVPFIPDHDYCWSSRPIKYSNPFKPYHNKVPRHSKTSTIVEIMRSPTDSQGIKIEVEQYNIPEVDLKAGILEKMDVNINKYKSKNDGNKSKDDGIIRMCKYSPDSLFKVSDQIAKTSVNFADKILDIEMRNLWGNVLHTSNEVTPQDVKLQTAICAWQTWYNGSRMVREAPLFYQCHICELAWWRLQPFRDHIINHDSVKLIISMKEHLHESFIIASYEIVNKLIYIPINDGDCYRCGENVDFHKDQCLGYTCSRCTKFVYTCSSLRDHEAMCLYVNLIIYNISVDRRCKICKHVLNSMSLMEKHMLEAHSVRSDIPVPTAFKTCVNCGGKYFTYTMHNCCKSGRNSSCEHCCRKFASTKLAVNHILGMHNKPMCCRICNKQLKTKCQEMEHLVNGHMSSYKMVFKCTICSEQNLLFMDEKSMVLHRQLWHQKKADKRRLFFEKMLVPISCLDEDNVEEAVLTGMPQIRSQKKKENKKVEDPGEQSKSFLVLTADVNVTVDEIDVKKEPMEVDENEEVDYEEMLLKMFNQSSNTLVSKPEVTSVCKKEGYSKTEEDNKTAEAFKYDHKKEDNNDKKEDNNDKKEDNNDKKEDNNDKKEDNKTEEDSKTEEDGKIAKDNKTVEVFKYDQVYTHEEVIEFDYSSVKVKAEPIDDIDITENPVEEEVQIKTEPVDPSEIDDEMMEGCYDYDEPSVKIERNDEPDDFAINDPTGTRDPASNKDETSSNDPTSNKDRTSSKYETSSNDPPSNKDTNNKDTKSDKDTKSKAETDQDDELIIKEEFVDSIPVKAEDEDTQSSEPFDNLITELEMFRDNKNTTTKFKYEYSIEVINSKGILKQKKMYTCRKCGYTAHHKKYRKHMDTKCLVSPGINCSYPCSLCGLTFVMFKNYVYHFEKHGYDLMRCFLCGAKFEVEFKFLSHMHKHIKGSFVGVHILDKSGEETKRSQRRVTCMICKQTVDQDTMFGHWEAQHLTLKEIRSDDEDSKLVIKEEPNPELTVDCERVTMNNKELEPAMLKLATDNLQLNSNDKECIICYRAFARRYDLKRHLVEHLLMDAHMKKIKYRDFRCQICSQGFPHQERYKFHMRGHGNMPIFMCELCNKTFSDSSNFAKHKKTHNVRCLVCDICKKKFHSKAALEKHISDHYSKPLTKCMFCPKTFHSKTSYKKHKYQVHQKPRYRCILCDIFFATVQNKWDHDWEVHQERKHVADCPICLKSFRKFSDVKVHARSEHRADVNMIKNSKVKGKKKNLQLFQIQDLKLKEKETLVVCE